ncbi:acyl-CoA synthetase (AMP-forming)/AMP-acid ligase II [Hephaestia caeni]|uniref:Acyl-CoA synthetase (AMP-forming)/AMP-acid ligase II n=1 Tax=Hephaestia caeni TaxID=645617 RepID=A0A397PFZ3_9SPHN|nr:class I adenylate-forming enzyme family protein [Hephaestia caeni]RIA44591.1 acyl-CoA synthetase (AMP-forming)/AMP-acid ligase II [Hephaestia caeni]
MATDLDRRMDAGIARLTGAGGPLPLADIVLGGRRLPMIASAPPALPHYFAHYCREHADATFLVAGDERITFAEIYTQAERVATALVTGFGVAKGDRVGIAMRNSPSWIALYMGVLMAGGIACLLNGWWQAEELAEAIRDVDCGLVFADPPRRERIAGAGLATTVIAIDDRPRLAEALAPVTSPAGGDAALPALTGDDDATILFTSGSTGRSKGALSDHRAVVQATYNYLAQALVMLGIATEQGNPPEGQPATLLTVPLFHVTAEIPVMLQSFAMGRKLVLMPKWDAGEAMRLIEAEAITYFVGVPLMSYEILTHPDRATYDLSKVTDFAAGGAPRPVEHVRRIKDEMGGAAPLIGYGLTETNAVGCGNWRDNYLAKPDSTGRASAPLVDLAILDGAGRPVPQGARGEIAIRSVCNFKRYWNDEGATRSAVTDDGYFLTGDIGLLDEDGYLFIVDRKKDIIIRGGENISCLEVEAAIYHHPAVAECAVFGLADDKYGEVPGAVIHYRAGDHPTDDELCAYLAEHIAAFKLPARLWISPDPLPRLGTEKIDKVSLRAHYRALAAAEGDSPLPR